MLTFEGAQFQGTQNILEKLKVSTSPRRTSNGLAYVERGAAFAHTSYPARFSLLLHHQQSYDDDDDDDDRNQNLPFQKVAHEVIQTDAQPTGADGSSLVVLVIGKLLVRIPSLSLSRSLFRLLLSSLRFLPCS